MNGDRQVPESILDAQVRRLLELVSEYRESECDALLTRARHDARQITRQARREARSRLRETVRIARQSVRDQIAAARARQHTAMMQARHRAATDFLERAWRLLAERLQARWEAPDSRRAWVRRVLVDAGATIPGRDWLLEHPPGWSEQEQREVRSTLSEDQARSLEFRCLDSLTAGIRIVTDGAVVDGSLQGLLADRAGIHALLLARQGAALAGDGGEERPGEAVGQDSVEGIVEQLNMHADDPHE